MHEGYKEVYFGTYCESCEFKDMNENMEPCSTCLENPINLHSHKPTMYKEGGK